VLASSVVVQAVVALEAPRRARRMILVGWIAVGARHARRAAATLVLAVPGEIVVRLAHDVGSMSGLPPRADLRTSSPQVSKVPKPAVSRCSKRCARMRGYSITSSARTRNDSEITSPIDLAVLRLTSKSSRTGSSIGKLPAFAPLRILSTNAAARRKFSATLIP
jgi:hypothetical protein